MLEHLSALEGSLVGTSIREWAWAFPTLEVLHFMGLAMLIGSMVVIDCRLLGFMPRLPIQALVGFMRLALVAFGINLITGILFFTADPLRYFPNIAFRIKMLLILIAGLNALWFKFAVFDKMANWQPQPPRPVIEKLIAGVSLAIWVGVIGCGRLIPYLEGM